MNKIIENTIEEYTINFFEKQSYKFIYAPSILPDVEPDEPLRRHFICEIPIHFDCLENGGSIDVLINLTNRQKERIALIPENNSLENLIRWSVLFALIYSSFFYILRLLVKLTLSSYHLASDAQERHQLIFQYLSLLQAKAIEEKDREIILQSLFSRADTGLLKGDSSPTMPDGLLNQIVKNLGG